MLSMLFRRLPSPALVVAVVALLFAAGGYASAGEKRNKDEVGVAVSTGGPVATGDPGVPVPIALSNGSFIQHAGEAMVIVARADLMPDENTFFCGVDLIIHLAPDSEGVSDLRLRLTAHSNKGEFGEQTDSGALAAPLVDTERTFVAFLIEDDQDNDPDTQGCDDPSPPEGPPGEDTWAATVTINVIALRD
jgi:hypothetical protein